MEGLRIPVVAGVNWYQGNEKNSIVLERNIRKKKARWEIIHKGPNDSRKRRRAVRELPRDFNNLRRVVNMFHGVPSPGLIAKFFSLVVRKVDSADYPIKKDLQALEDAKNISSLIGY